MYILGFLTKISHDFSQTWSSPDCVCPLPATVWKVLYMLLAYNPLVY